jgi:hypothetical protein
MTTLLSVTDKNSKFTIYKKVAALKTKYFTRFIMKYTTSVPMNKALFS